MAYAIVETGGKQYKTEEGDVLDVELLGIDAGKKVKFDKVLLVSDKSGLKVGKPYITGAVVEGEVLNNFRDRKVVSFKYIRRENGSKTKIGHRQPKTKVKITALAAK